MDSVLAGGCPERDGGVGAGQGQAYSRSQDDDDNDDNDDDDDYDDDEEEIGVTSWQLAAIKEIAKSFLFRRRKTVTLLKYLYIFS